MKLKNIIWVMLATVCLVLAGCGSNDSSSKAKDAHTSSEDNTVDGIKKKGKIVIATGDYYPFEYLDKKTQKLVGYDIDLGNKIGKALGVDVEWKQMQFTALVPSLQNKQVDLVIGAMYITDERKEVVDFADPYLDTGMVLVKAKNDKSISSKKDLDGKKVGVKAGATSEQVAQKLKAEGANIKIVAYKEALDAIKDLEIGRVDVVVNDYLNQLGYFQTYPDSNLEIVGKELDHSELGIAASKGNDSLISEVNKVLAEMEKSGEKDQLFKKWLENNQ
ncbi:ABC transporter substrate-binding protein [Rummeliibacillus sp. SL167]|uniref:substrate-binding periplasmic protein n=1 Tax=Rummeliibacillus sp. SL167 TaxID=2579792 RepID=UPI0011B47B17|nr:transporter substrate-binding domain-containing protein [Rummeliibacillus sp. SL167]